MTLLKSIYIILIICVSQYAKACNCKGIITDTTIVVIHTQTIVKGEIISSEFSNDTIVQDGCFDIIPLVRYKMNVERIFSGRRQLDTLIIESRPYDDMCGFVFTIGERYIVFSNDPNSEGVISTSICTLTNEYNSRFEERIKKDLKITWP